MHGSLAKILEDDEAVADNELLKDLESILDDHDADIVKDGFLNQYF